MNRREILRSLFFRTSTVGALINSALPHTGETEELKALPVNRFRSRWHLLPDAELVSEALCAHGLHDWCIKNGELNCVTHGINRTVHVLTHQLSSGNNSFKVNFIFRFLNQPVPEDDIENFAGFRLGINVRPRDRYTGTLKDTSIDAGVTRNGYLFIGKTFDTKKIDEKILTEKIRLQLSVTPRSTGGNFAKLKAMDRPGNTIATLSSAEYDALAWQGNIALVSHCKTREENKDQPTIAISKFEIEGEKITMV
jgi:alkaline phosphatase D